MFKKILSIAILLFGFLSLTTIALNPTLDKNYFFVNPNNFLSQELFQTRNGIISHNIQYVNGSEISRYIILDINSKDATPILENIVTACEIAPATFQHLHYHVQTGSLVYFCPKNTSLLIIDQSSYTVQASIPFNFNETWPVAKLSTDGTNVAVLGMDIISLSTSGLKNSTLVKVNMQTRQVETQILFDQGLSLNETVVAFASSQRSAYIATNKINGTNLTTAIYHLATIGNSYQLTSVSNFSTTVSIRIITKLFCLGSYIVTNNGQDLYFVNQQGSITQKGQLHLKSLAIYSQNQLFQPFMTSQYDGTYLYAVSAQSSVDRYNVYAQAILTKSLGSYYEIQVAYGNQTSGDLMFALDYPRIKFTILDLQTFKTRYSAICGYDDLMLTNTTYAVVKSDAEGIPNLFIFDLKTDSTVSNQRIGNNYHYNKDQHLISFLKTTSSPGCVLEHVDLMTGKSWNTLNFAGNSNPVCNSWIADLRMTEKGNPEVVFPLVDNYLIISETYGEITFPANSSTITSLEILNVIDFDDLSLYYLFVCPETNETNVSLSSYNPQSKQFEVQGFVVFSPLPVQNKGFFIVGPSMTVALSNISITLIDTFFAHINYPLPNQFPGDWNLVSSFQDSDGKQYILGTNTGIPSGNSFPGLFDSSAQWMDLPEFKPLRTARAQAAGPKSYWIHDDLYSAIGLIRFYNAANENASLEKTLISI